jgi:leucine dehydrogenase
VDIKAEIQKRQHEQVVFCNDPTTGLFSIIAIHDTTLGPALGGCRMWSYRSVDEAIIDALRLSRGMTYKAALAGLKLGGGKSVIMGNAKTDKSEALFKRFGEFVNSLGGKYITAEDVGTSVEDMSHVLKSTKHVVGIPRSQGGSGDPSPFTALGVFHGIRASLQFLNGNDRLKGIKVAVQGVGHVGSHLVGHLVKAGANVFVSDVDKERLHQVLEKYPGQVQSVDPQDILFLNVDVVSPCALGAVINDDSLDHIQARIVAGAANNQLKEDRHGELLFKKGKLYAPDFCINAGGLINVYQELIGYDEAKATQLTENIYNSLMDIYKLAASQNISTSKAADLVAIERIEKARKHPQ